jgi:hypothetical protein
MPLFSFTDEEFPHRIRKIGFEALVFGDEAVFFRRPSIDRARWRRRSGVLCPGLEGWGAYDAEESGADDVVVSRGGGVRACEGEGFGYE